MDGPRRRLAEVVAARNDPRWGQLLGNEQLLVTFHPTASPETVNAAQKIVEEEGGSVSYYLPDHTLLLLGNLVAAERLQQLDGVHWVVSISLQISNKNTAYVSSPLKMN